MRLQLLVRLANGFEMVTDGLPLFDDVWQQTSHQSVELEYVTRRGLTSRRRTSRNLLSQGKAVDKDHDR